MLTTQKAVRDQFWAAREEFSRIPGNTQNDYPADLRCAFVDYVDHLARDGQISEDLAQRVTL